MAAEGGGPTFSIRCLLLPLFEFWRARRPAPPDRPMIEFGGTAIKSLGRTGWKACATKMMRQSHTENRKPKTVLKGSTPCVWASPLITVALN